MKKTESKRPMKKKTIARVGDRNQQEKIEKLARINHSMYAYTCHLRKKRTRWKIKWDDGSIFSFTGRHRTCCLPRIVAFSNKILPLFKLEKKKKKGGGGGGGGDFAIRFFVIIPELAIELNTKLFHPVKTWKMRIPTCRSATKQFTSKKNDTLHQKKFKAIHKPAVVVKGILTSKEKLKDYIRPWETTTFLYNQESKKLTFCH